MAGGNSSDAAFRVRVGVTWLDQIPVPRLLAVEKEKGRRSHQAAGSPKVSTQTVSRGDNLPGGSFANHLGVAHLTVFVALA